MLTPAPLPPAPFQIIQSLVLGLRLVAAHRRLFAVLSFFPVVVTLATMIALRFIDDSLTMFWLPVVQLPSSFVIGLQCALILRFIVLQEYPLIPEGAAKRDRNTSVTHAALIYAAVTYFVTGAYAGLVKLRAYMTANMEETAVYAPLLVAGLILLLWSARWFWLHIPVALGWQVRGFYVRIGAWGGSLRVFGLFALCSLILNFVTTFLRLGVAAFAGKNPSGFFQAFDDVLVSMATVVLAVLFTAASASAVRLMAGKAETPQ